MVGGRDSPFAGRAGTLTLDENGIYCAGLARKAFNGGTMSEIPGGFFYTEEHEYLKPTDEEGVFFVGVTDYAQGELGDVVYIELPEVGATFDKMDPFGNIEAVKAVSDLFCPVAGEIVAVNAALDDDPAVVNSDPYGDGWIVKLRVSDPAQVSSLLDSGAYTELVGG